MCFIQVKVENKPTHSLVNKMWDFKLVSTSIHGNGPETIDTFGEIFSNF